MSDSLPCPAEWRPNNLVSIGKVVWNVNTCGKEFYDFHKIPQRVCKLRQIEGIGTPAENLRAVLVGVYLELSFYAMMQRGKDARA